MKLSLSVRIAESFRDKTKTTMGLEELAQLAVDNEYHAVCMRASVAGIHTSKERMQQIRKTLDTLSLKVSMITGDFAVPQNNEHGPEALRHIRPYLDLAGILDCSLIRIAMKHSDDIPWAQRASDEAHERGIRLAHQCHTQSLFETVEGSLEVLRSVGRPNFGLIYEPANLEICAQDYGLDTIQKFAPYLFNVYVQNQRANPNGQDALESWSAGTFRFDHVPLHDPTGLDWQLVFDSLAATGYSGYATVHQALAEIMPAPEAARMSAEYLRSVGDFEPVAST